MKSYLQDLRKIGLARRIAADSTNVRQGCATTPGRFCVSPNLMRFALLALAGCTAMGNLTSSAPTQSSAGVLTNINGMTLYVFDNDPKGKSTCNDVCAKLWPPLLVREGDRSGGDYAIVTREDGRKQWAYKGKPLYLWLKDKKPGDKTGEGVNGLWRTAKP